MKPPGRSDGVTIAPAPGGRKTLLLLACAGALAAIALLTLFGPRRQEPAPSPPAPTSAREARVAAPAAAPPRAAFHPVRAAPAEPTAPPPEDAPAAAPQATREITPIEPIAPSGIGLFPPPGTDPPKIGIVVPDGFELPEGYVRHYQVTDDGQALPPILMFHPDYDWVDESGAHVEPSENGVVPPELAPPGMPIEMLELPEPPSEP